MLRIVYRLIGFPKVLSQLIQPCVVRVVSERAVSVYITRTTGYLGQLCLLHLEHMYTLISDFLPSQEVCN